jgi:hypothetical protein
MTISGAIMQWIDCLVLPACACRITWSAAAMLPRQPCSRSNVCHNVDPAGNGDAECDRHDYGVCQ